MIRTAEISASIDAAMADHGQRAIACRIDVARSTLGDWGHDVHAWPADKLLQLAAQFPEIRRAVVDAIDGASARPSSNDAERDAFVVMADAGRTMSGLAQDLSDRRLTAEEARVRLPQLRELQDHLHRLIIDADAVARGGL
jgi:hypothetical protein